MKKLSHYDAAGSARMVDVSAKLETRRMARAQAFVRIRPAVLKQLPRNPKGNPLEIARIAGIACVLAATAPTGVRRNARVSRSRRRCGFSAAAW